MSYKLGPGVGPYFPFLGLGLPYNLVVPRLLLGLGDPKYAYNLHG